MLSFKAQHNKCHLNIGFTINPNQQVRANPAKPLARETLIIIILLNNIAEMSLLNIGNVPLTKAKSCPMLA